MYVHIYIYIYIHVHIPHYEVEEIERRIFFHLLRLKIRKRIRPKVFMRNKSYTEKRNKKSRFRWDEIAKRVIYFSLDDRGSCRCRIINVNRYSRCNRFCSNFGENSKDKSFFRETNLSNRFTPFVDPSLRIVQNFRICAKQHSE